MVQKKKNVQLNEVDRHLSTMELHIRSGYEDWIDIIPQLRQEKEIQEKYDKAVMSSVSELLDQRMKLAQVVDAQEKKNLEEQIKKLEQQLKELKNEGRAVTGSRITRTGFLNAQGLYSSVYICDTCGKKFIRNSLNPVPPQRTCAECHKKGQSNPTLGTPPA